VWRLTGKSLSSLQGVSKETLPFKIKAFALVPSSREQLHKTIGQRFDAMLAAGLLDELSALRKQYALTEGMPSMRCVGYRQAWEYLEQKASKNEMRDRALAATRQLAKRQMTWLRSFPDLTPLPAGGPDDAESGLLTPLPPLLRTCV
jgi:tRNA dimethylallyltransferase